MAWCHLLFDEDDREKERERQREGIDRRGEQKRNEDENEGKKWKVWSKWMDDKKRILKKIR